jgi:hypothetical protein
MPVWARRGSRDETVRGEIASDDAKPSLDKPVDPRPNWDQFVAEQIEAFERFFAADTRPPADWSTLWRKSWWPKADARKRFPKSAPRDLATHPYFRKGEPEFARALAVATPMERKIFEQIGVAQFKPDDPRLGRVRLDTPTPPSTALTARITGERE